MMKLPRLPSTARPMSRDKADTLLLLAACSLVLVPHIGHLPPWTSWMCGVLLLWRGWITFRGNRMPSHWVLVPIAALSMIGVFSTYKTFFGREAGVAMLVLLLSFKLLEMRSKRDLFSVVFVNFFLMLTNFFYSQSIGTALMMVAAVIAILTTQLSFQYTGVVPSLKKRLGLGAMIFGLAVPLTLVLFILFPRIQGPLWGLPSDANAGRTGLSDSMAPGNISNLAQSDEVAFRVKFLDPAPPKSRLYWRGVVLGNFDGRTWTQQPSYAKPGRQISLRVHGTPIRHEVTLEPNNRHWLFALELPQAAPQIAGNPASFSTDLQLLAAQPINERVRYDAASYVDFDLQPNEPAAALREWLRLPRTYNPRTLEFAARLRQQGDDKLQRINAALTFFRNEKFTYTLEPPLLGVHTVDDFLFSTRAGFCEHYASAFVVLMRALDIPARVVTGYQGGEINPIDGYMTVRQSDAHAWAEVWLENRGWIRVDPTAAVAPERIERNLATVIPRRLFGGLVNLNLGKNSWLSDIRLNWDAVTNGWNQWVLNYTPDKQRSFIRSLGFDNADWHTLIGLLFSVGVLVMTAIAYPLVMKRPKRDPVQAVYAKFCDEFARRGLMRAGHEGPRAYLARLTAPDSPLAADKKIAVARFLRFYEAVQYGTVAKLSPASTVSQLKSLLVECR